jgi:hypothetical protein
VQCESGFWNPLMRAENQSACRICPPRSASPRASYSKGQCICEAGYFNLKTDDVVCEPCMLGTRCNRSGITLQTLPLLRGWWRPDAGSLDVRQCPDSNRLTSGCIGGKGNPCKEHTSGPYCRLCNSTDALQLYYEADASECKDCGGVGGGMAQMWAASGVPILLLFLYKHFFGARIRVLCRRRYARQLNKWTVLRVQIRIVWSTMQIMTRVPSVYQLSLPKVVASVLAAITPIVDVSLGYFPVQLLECMGFGGYLSQLVFSMLLPFAILALAYPLVRSGTEHRPDASISARMRQQMERALPFSLLLSFVSFPVVSNQAFRAFLCEQMEDMAYLQADYSIRCDGSSDAAASGLSHNTIKAWASLAIALFPVGIPLLYCHLLLKVRKKLLSAERSKLSTALGFLHRPYQRHTFWWELVNAAQKLILIGFFVLLKPGSFTQLALGMCIALFFAVLQLQVQPYRRLADNLLAASAQISLVLFFSNCILFRVHELTTDFDAINEQLSSEWASSRFTMPPDFVPFLMLFSLFAALMMMTVLHTVHVFLSQDVSIFLWRSDKLPVLPPPLETGQFHTFLSHNWATGQVCAVPIRILPGPYKRRALMPQPRAW